MGRSLEALKKKSTINKMFTCLVYSMDVWVLKKNKKASLFDETTDHQFI